MWSIKGCFVSKAPQNEFSLPILNKKEKIKKFGIFDQNHGLIPLAECKVFDFLMYMVYYGLQTVFFFSLKTLPKSFSFPILSKKKKLRIFEFLAITMD